VTLRAARPAVGVGSDWCAAEGGQKLKGNPYDAIKLKKYPDKTVTPKKGEHTGRLLLGWVDIGVFVDPVPQTETAGGAAINVWENEDGEVVHPDAPAGAGAATP
jgi:hypothetical protein